MASIKVEIVRSEKREIDELDTKPFTMYVLNVVRAVPESDAAPADAGADGAAGGAEANEAVEVALTKNEKGYGLGFDQYGGAVFVTRIVAGGAAEATGQIKEGQRFVKCGEQAAAGMSKADVVQYLGGVETAQLTLQEDTAAYLAGKQAKEAAKNKWVLHRRYSQFNELKENLAKSHSAVIKSITFPPKVLLGNLQPKVIQQRTVELNSFLNELLSHDDKAIREAPELLAFLEASDATVKVGSPAPKITLTDLNDRAINSDIDDEIVVFTAASRYNFQKLTEFVKPAQAEVLALFPNVRITFISVADLRIVPAASRGMVQPILRKMEAKDALETINNFITGGFDGYMSMEPYFIPDYSGDILNSINCTDANWTFRVFLCCNGRVFKSLQSSQQNLRKEYVGAITSAVKKFPVFAAPVTDANTKSIQKGEEKVGARQSFAVEFDLEAPGVIALSFSCSGATEFHLSTVGKDGKETKVLVSRSYKQGFKKRTRVGAGHHVMSWKPAGMLSSSTLTYDVRQVV